MHFLKVTDTTLSLSQGQLKLESFINRDKTIATRRASTTLGGSEFSNKMEELGHPQLRINKSRDIHNLESKFKPNTRSFIEKLNFTGKIAKVFTQSNRIIEVFERLTLGLG